MLCAVIAKKNFMDILNLAKKIGNLNSVGAIEFRLDYVDIAEFKNLDWFCDNVSKIKGIKNKIKIATCMLKQEGGNFTGNEDERIEILKKACNFSDYLTIEIKSFQQHPRKMKALFNSNLILSYHNFAKCPDINEIEKILNNMEKIRVRCKGDIIKKIAVKFESFDDNYKILPFLTEEKNFRNIIMLGMGKYGKLSRILNHYFGFLTYVNVEEKTAEGQLCVKEFEEILKILKEQS
ncbi:MAG: type I 3-dehydroquinate dehydratase [Candidatus Altiarchaeum hamiconexum]|uniref:3-dehydroquinate dehydratase n=1 Tax=Candidatus Altarchaeum hamiconexum TaxID=1803513 RepID=A0A8J8CG78_9ARCH|nr:type I 3-dehydroquinate dehydratase [Candidatus Altarchaeum hamiconexum]OIQ06313.1 MAG: hypothetical protein AUK59_00310 [Candidatus Altarchaeum sp. CG2_30_32_3053]PIV28487.1 MAG: hypothetical protein COS36_01965 [Candidatus Altarchaeum sp. CG03_land_8_20_14_0_80_32_618]PIX48781.1 MAG: hypothetical protein COZ53_02860 [Candidatus Altarchaeum sp. CG_4_8_14_3_um_filter_33_2054]PJC15307.1 MAG: hypothetical protein CO063_01330 [Candidatus Altarchaeum sp. CG_4_9_14_0_8_um_filter_32_206]